MILIGGGSGSGKSRAALRMLTEAGPRRGFIATAQAWDDEMRERIARHRFDRDPAIVTWEEPYHVAQRIQAEARGYDAIVVDCLTLWLTNLVLREDDGRNQLQIANQCRELITACAEAQTTVILVTNEVGCGIVPDNALARRFRDHAGRLNQLAAEQAAEVHWMAFGIGMRLK